eukprot:6349325-Pyramimonas_sp.AAC.1
MSSQSQFGLSDSMLCDSLGELDALHRRQIEGPTLAADLDLASGLEKNDVASNDEKVIKPSPWLPKLTSPAPQKHIIVDLEGGDDGAQGSDVVKTEDGRMIPRPRPSAKP